MIIHQGDADAGEASSPSTEADLCPAPTLVPGVATWIGRRCLIGQVWFTAASSDLNATAAMFLQRLAAAIPEGSAAQTTVDGWVQYNPRRNHDGTLCAQRAAIVADVLTACGLPGTVVVRGRGAGTPDPTWRKVSIRIEYTPASAVEDLP